MDIKLSKKITNAKIIEGFPGFGLIGTITTEFLRDHLKTEQIGTYWFEDLPASIAIHDGKEISPVEIHYNKKYNLVIIHSIAGMPGIEWKAAELVLEVAKQVKSKEIISLEGVGAFGMSKNKDPKVFYHSNDNKKKKNMEKIGMEPLKEGIIVGVTSALLLKSKLPITCFFAETKSGLPDSKASAKMVEILDSYLRLKVDSKPLLKQAQKFEEKLKTLVSQGQQTMDIREKKQLSYVG